MKPGDVLISFSLALYSQWFYHKPTRCLFDAGEGVATTLGKKVFAIRSLFLSHGHEDHIAGISNLVNVRNLAVRRARETADYLLSQKRSLDQRAVRVCREQAGRAAPISIVRCAPGYRRRGCDRVRQAAYQGCAVRNATHKRAVVPLLCDRAGAQSNRSRHLGRWRAIIPYSSTAETAPSPSTPPATGSTWQSTRRLFLAGMLARPAQVDNRHCTVEKAVDWAAGQDVKALILCHISERYCPDEVALAARAAASKYGFRGESVRCPSRENRAGAGAWVTTPYAVGTRRPPG